MRSAIVAAAVAAGCSFHASYDGTHYKCAADGTCPGGQTCVAGECVLDPNAPDAPPGTPDAAPGTPDGPASQARCGTLALLRDDFSTDRFGTTWDKWSDGAPTATVTGGHLAISIPSNGNDLGAGYSSNFYYDFNGSQVQATISKAADTSTILEVRDHRNGKLQMVVESGILYAGVFGNVANQGTRAQIAYDPAVQKHWRLREDAGVVYWDWSTDGSAWTELWHEADPIRPDHVIVELSADGNGPSEADFDELNIGAPQPALGLCAASSITDDFLTSNFDPKWETWADNGTTIASTGGGAVITNNASADDWAGFQSRHLFDLRGDSYYVDANMVPQVKPFVAWVQAMVPGDGTTVLEFNVEGTQLQMLQKINGSNTDSQTLTYDPIAHRFWRFRAAGSTVYWDTSPDAAAWTMRFSATAQLDPSAVMFVMGGGEYSGGDPVSTQTERIGSINLP